MKTTVLTLGTILLAGAVALAQSGTTGATSKSSKSSSSPQNSSSSTSKTSAGNSGFDSSDSSPAGSSATSSQGAYSSSASDTSATATQSSSSSSGSISNGPVAETVSDSSALIGWATRDSASNTGLKYGTTRANLSETAQGTDGADGKNHHARLSGLSPSTRYYFQVTENGSPVSGVGTFKTTASGETPVQSKAIIPQK